MKTITQTYTIKAPVEKVWEALVNPAMIEKWGGGPVKMDDEVGTNFSLWGGDIYGTNTKVVPHTILEQDWYGGEWEKPSKVIFKLSEKDGVTTLDMTHTNLPEESESDFADGWKNYYCGPIKELVEQ